MPFVMKAPHGKSKGILILTHKEKRFLSSPCRSYEELLRKVAEQYFIGVHWGHYHENVETIPYADFHLAGKGTVSFKPGSNPYHIELCSRNFIPACFRSDGSPKQWDIINVSRPLNLKNLDQFMRVIRKIYDLKIFLKVLLVAPCPPDLQAPGFYRDIYDDYLRMFSREERSSFTLMMLSPDGYPFQLPSETMAYLYRCSKVFTLFSDREGESRVISEALLCGLPVVVKEGLTGGGRDYLTGGNSRTFATLEEARDIFIELCTNYGRYAFDAEALRGELSEEGSARVLLERLGDFYRSRNVPFTGEVDTGSLDRKLPGHFVMLPRSLRCEFTNDLNSFSSSWLYLNSLTGADPGCSTTMLLRLYDLLATLHRQARGVAGRLAAPFLRVGGRR